VKYPTITQKELGALLERGWKYKGAGLYEPDHAPKGTIFKIYPPVGLIRLIAPSTKEE